MSKLHLLSLCSGIGGAELGAEMTGMIEVVGQVENDPFCQTVLAKHWPHVLRLADIHHVQGDEFGEVDIEVAGFPCQPHSLSGKRKASADKRDLWPQVARIIRATQPRWFVGENVSGLLSSDAGRFFGGILSDLDEMGYRVGWCVYGAGEIGAPHKRERVFLVAYSPSIGQRTRRPQLSGQQWALQLDRTDTSCSYVAHSTSREDGRLCQRGIQSNAWANSENVAHTCSDRRWIGTHQQERGCECERTPNTCVYGESRSMAYATSEGLQKWRRVGLTTSETQTRTGVDAESERCGQVAHTDYQRCTELDSTAIPGDQGRYGRSVSTLRPYRTTQPCMGRGSHGFPSWLDGHRWPAGPGQEQEAWEPPRIITKKEKYRNKRLKALGNAIVPQQIYPLFQAIVDVEQQFIS